MTSHPAKRTILFFIITSIVLVSCSTESAPEPTDVPQTTETLSPPTATLRPSSTPIQYGEIFGCIYMEENDELVPAYCDEDIPTLCLVGAAAIDAKGDWNPKTNLDEGEYCYTLKLPAGDHTVLGKIYYSSTGECPSDYSNESEYEFIQLDAGQSLEVDFLVVQPNMDDCR
jgi:hypothetical protein